MSFYIPQEGISSIVLQIVVFSTTDHGEIVKVIQRRCSSRTRLLLCPLFLLQVQFPGRVVDTPVEFNDRGHGPDGAVLGQGYCYVRCLTTGAVPRLVVDTPVVFNDRGHDPDCMCFYDSCTPVQTLRNVWRCRRCRSAWLWTSL